MLGIEFIKEFYPPEEATRARRMNLASIVDAFQHWRYTHHDHFIAERDAAFATINQRFRGGDDWVGLEAARNKWWHRVPHIFCDPFYYIEYGIAQLGALQVWLKWKRDPAGALRALKQGLASGNRARSPSCLRLPDARLNLLIQRCGR